MKNGKELDSAYSMVEFEKPVSSVNLSDTLKGIISGMALKEILTKRQLSYKVIIEMPSAPLTLERRRIIFFDIDNLNSSKQVFEADY